MVTLYIKNTWILFIVHIVYSEYIVFIVYMQYIYCVYYVCCILNPARSGVVPRTPLEIDGNEWKTSQVRLGLWLS